MPCTQARTAQLKAVPGTSMVCRFIRRRFEVMGFGPTLEKFGGFRATGNPPAYAPAFESGIIRELTAHGVMIKARGR